MNQAIRSAFPILSQTVRGQDLIYLDNAATTQKPEDVLIASSRYYREYNSNIHRGTHHLSQQATRAHEDARVTIAQHINASKESEIIFTSGCTDSINMVAHMLSQGFIQAGDEILISSLEHHSNIVPWQMLCEQTGAELKVIPLTSDQSGLDLSAYQSLLSPKTKLVSINHISNSLGTLNPIKEMIQSAHQVQALTLIDGAQAVPHQQINVQDLNADFYVFSGHKAYAPTGIGVLYAKHSLLEQLPPVRGGGEMIKQVTFEHSSYNDPPLKYEAGTPHIEGAIALAAACTYLNSISFETIQHHESTLLTQLFHGLSSLEGVTIYGGKNPGQHHGALSFNVQGIHHYDLGTLLDQMGIAVRTGHHCCQPLMNLLNISGTVRASVALYNTSEEIDLFLNALKKSISMLR